MKINQKPTRGFTLVELLVVIAIIAALAALVSPQVLRGLKKADFTTATSNARQIGLAMFDFQIEYGRFPDANTETQVTNNFPNAEVKPKQGDANGFFRQLFTANITQSEDIFYVKTSQTIRPDGVIDNAGCLNAGENGFGYIMNGTVGLTTGGNAARVIAVTPLDSSGNFDPDPFDKKAATLRIDQSVQAVNINASGEALLGGGKKLLDSGTGTIWGTVTPVIQDPIFLSGGE